MVVDGSGGAMACFCVLWSICDIRVWLAFELCVGYSFNQPLVQTVHEQWACDTNTFVARALVYKIECCCLYKTNALCGCIGSVAAFEDMLNSNSFLKSAPVSGGISSPDEVT